MNKTELLQYIESEINFFLNERVMDADTDRLFDILSAIEKYKKRTKKNDKECQHEWVDATNAVVLGCEICKKCQKVIRLAGVENEDTWIWITDEKT